MYRYLTSYIFPMLVHILSTITPEFRAIIKEALAKLANEAHKTPNSVDDIVVKMLMDIIDIPNIANSYED